MLCEKCKSRQATIHKQATINGQSHSEHLCSECAAKENNNWFNDFDQYFQGDSLFGNSPFSNWFQPLFQNHGSVKDKQEVVPKKACPHCGTTWEEFQKKGLLGCAECYTHFADELPPLLRRLHGQGNHIGKTLEKVLDKPLSEKEKLQKKMNEAVKAENFEEAARIRDQIKTLDMQSSSINEGDEEK